MRLSLKEFKKSFSNALLEIHWRHWASLGIASHVKPEKNWIVDLEALIISTLAIGLLEKRLLSSSLEWLVKNGQWINLSRLRRIAEYFMKPIPALQQPVILSEIFELLVQQYNKSIKGSQVSEEQACYGAEENIVKEYKNMFHTFRPKGMVMEPVLQNPSLIQLLLRGTFGVDARTEILIYLLTNESGNSNSIAKEVFYNQKNVYRILEQWTSSQMVSKLSKKRSALYFLQKKEELLRTIGCKELPAYINWVRTLLWFDQIARALSVRPWSEDEYLMSSFFREILDEAKYLGKTLNIIIPNPASYPGKEYFVPFTQAVLEIMEKLERHRGR